MLLLPQPQSNTEADDVSQLEGRHDAKPIKLDQSITALQFTHFLLFIYPL